MRIHEIPFNLSFNLELFVDNKKDLYFTVEFRQSVACSCIPVTSIFHKMTKHWQLSTVNFQLCLLHSFVLYRVTLILYNQFKLESELYGVYVLMQTQARFDVKMGVNGKITVYDFWLSMSLGPSIAVNVSVICVTVRVNIKKRDDGCIVVAFYKYNDIIRSNAERCYLECDSEIEIRSKGKLH